MLTGGLWSNVTNNHSILRKGQTEMERVNVPVIGVKQKLGHRKNTDVLHKKLTDNKKRKNKTKISMPYCLYPSIPIC